MNPFLTWHRDTVPHAVVKRVDDMEPLLTRNEVEKISLIEERFRENVDLMEMLG